MSDHYLEQLRHQLAQTRAELRRAEDELAVHRQRASRETRFRLAWQSARRRANWQRAILADYRTEADARAAELEDDEAWRSMWPFGPILPLWQPEHLGAAFGEVATPWWAVRAEEERQRDLVRERLDGQLPVAPRPMALPAEEQTRYRVRQALNIVKLPAAADMANLVAIAREQQDRAVALAFWNPLIYGPEPQP